MGISAKRLCIASNTSKVAIAIALGTFPAARNNSICGSSIADINEFAVFLVLSSTDVATRNSKIPD